MINAKKILLSLMTAGIFFLTPQITFADEVDEQVEEIEIDEEEIETVADLQHVPEDIYTWVQSTDRAHYYFNHKQINYEVSDEGFINLDVLIVPTVCIYDEVQIEDVVSKRRWKRQSLEGYDKLVGRADYLQFNLIDETVQVTERIDLDDQWGTLSTDKSGQPIKLSDLKPNSVECRFYRSILTWAKKHNAEIIKHSWGKLSPDDKKLSQDEMPLLKLNLP